jgi:hypothetical protein
VKAILARGLRLELTQRFLKSMLQYPSLNGEQRATDGTQNETERLIARNKRVRDARLRASEEFDTIRMFGSRVSKEQARKWVES